MVRVGEASNPGPPQVRPRFVEDGVDNVLSSLELELTMLDSDEEPLVRSVDGRHVVPRIHDIPPPTVPVSFAALEAVERTHVPWFHRSWPTLAKPTLAKPTLANFSVLEF